jgi:transposase
LKALKETTSTTAGIDLGATFHKAAVNPDLCENPIEEFGVDTASLHEMANWLLSHGVQNVAIESTGVYWMPVYEVLEERGLRVMLVDGQRAMHLPGRTKTDALDAAWLEKLLRHGMLSSVFVPVAELIPLRTYRRLRGQYVEKSSAEIQRMHKALQQMNVRLDRALTDIAGVTGMAIIKAILAGERNPQKLASLRRRGVKKDEAEIARDLDGNFQSHYLFCLSKALSEYEHIAQSIAEIDEKIRAELIRLSPPEPPNGILPPSKKSRRKNQPYFDLRSHLASLVGPAALSIPGIDAPTALTVIGECGMDMTRWPTEGHYVSWLGLCPMHRITGGKIKRSRSKRVRNDAATAFRLAAQSLNRSNSALGCTLRRISIRRGMPKAITALARILATHFYRAVRYQKPYEDIGRTGYEQAHREKTLHNMARTASRLGFRLVPLEPEQCVVS